MDDHPLMCNWLGIEPSWDVLARRLLMNSLHLPSLIRPLCLLNSHHFKLHTQAFCKNLSARWDEHHHGYPKSHVTCPQDPSFQRFPFIVICKQPCNALWYCWIVLQRQGVELPTPHLYKFVFWWLLQTPANLLLSLNESRFCNYTAYFFPELSSEANFVALFFNIRERFPELPCWFSLKQGARGRAGKAMHALTSKDAPVDTYHQALESSH